MTSHGMSGQGNRNGSGRKTHRPFLTRPVFGAGVILLALTWYPENLSAQTPAPAPRSFQGGEVDPTQFFRGGSRQDFQPTTGSAPLPGPQSPFPGDDIDPSRFSKADSTKGFQGAQTPRAVPVSATREARPGKLSAVKYEAPLPTADPPGKVPIPREPAFAIPEGDQVQQEVPAPPGTLRTEAPTKRRAEPPAPSSNPP